MNGATSHRVAGEVRDEHLVRAQVDDLVLPELDRVAGELDERRDVGGQEVLAVADPDDERGVAPRGHEAPGLVGADRDQRERPGQPLAGRAHRIREVPGLGKRGLQQVRHHLGVGLGGHHDAALGELRGELGEVLDDAVVDHRDPPPARDVRVGVDVGRAAVGGPPGVPDPGRGRRHGIGGEQGPQVLQLARLLADLQVAVGHDRDPGGVVPPVLQPLQAGNHHVDGRSVPRVPHDSAHGPKGSRPA